MLPAKRAEAPTIKLPGHHIHTRGGYIMLSAPQTTQTPGQTARAGNRRFGLVSALHAHTKAPYKTDLLWEMRALKRPGGPGHRPTVMTGTIAH
jgi:hypothetical protein